MARYGAYDHDKPRLDRTRMGAGKGGGEHAKEDALDAVLTEGHNFANYQPPPKMPPLRVAK